MMLQRSLLDSAKTDGFPQKRARCVSGCALSLSDETRRRRVRADEGIGPYEGLAATRPYGTNAGFSVWTALSGGASGTFRTAGRLSACRSRYSAGSRRPLWV